MILRDTSSRWAPPAGPFARFTSMRAPSRFPGPPRGSVRGIRSDTAPRRTGKQAYAVDLRLIPCQTSLFDHGITCIRLVSLLISYRLAVRSTVRPRRPKRDSMELVPVRPGYASSTHGVRTTGRDHDAR